MREDAGMWRSAIRRRFWIALACYALSVPGLAIMVMLRNYGSGPVLGPIGWAILAHWVTTGILLAALTGAWIYDVRCPRVLTIVAVAVWGAILEGVIPAMAYDNYQSSPERSAIGPDLPRVMLAAVYIPMIVLVVESVLVLPVTMLVVKVLRFHWHGGAAANGAPARPGRAPLPHTPPTS